MIPPRLVPLLEQFDFARERLTARLTGPVMDSGDGSDTEVRPMTDAEYFWEPVADCWSVRERAAGPGPRATLLAGAGPWGRDAAAYPHPWPPPVTTIAWRLSHLGEMIALRADHVAGSRTLTREVHPVPGSASEAVAAFDAATAAWHAALLGADDTALDTVGYSSYPHGSDPQDVFVDVVWWVNQELLHHGAEIALLRDLYRARPR
ncbi:DinB family protein [Streptomyces sp. H34-S4]|uniref:DinB family protein n=1 Tax=Streptomyces sp. H34-S4 TaxID=2996463 RepID=UPI0022706754|nr:DinB family protein [Streptomyces sp. H34-S4]MCY0934229.1 DinB family protein [Streptomyces sp. H34-S4]